ncbi:MAG: hypothetical protein C0459_13040 [Chitinophaga sp.]|jgi:hypothetical protein|nr:hypothetical protein [Chitinophaga sp.]
MNLLPFRRYQFSSKLSSINLLEKLDSNIELYQGLRFDNYNFSTKLFVGKLRDNSFKIRPILRGRNSFIPIIQGKLINRQSTTSIILKMRINYFVSAFFIWISITLIFFESHKNLSNILFAIFIYIIVIYLFNIECNKAIKSLQNIFEIYPEY